MTTPARLYLKRWSCEETFGTNRLAGRLIETAGSSPGLMWKETEKRKKLRVSKLAAAIVTLPVFISLDSPIHSAQLNIHNFGECGNFTCVFAVTVGAFYYWGILFFLYFAKVRFYL